ncbi:hypothetical protein F7R26_004785 [Cupriavidus basilensis]|uniref:Uncharacterized protein n=1 Tax=Cupriavidus basilensis TaxID=68895 RepID=A0A7M2GX46_9BURK|nr:hypothetical protein F7R26_004785 [Cupriavidus basilensis]
MHIAIRLPVAFIVAFLRRQGAAIQAVIGARAGFHSFDLGAHMVLPFRAHTRHFPCALAGLAMRIAHNPAFGPAMLPKRDLSMADSIEAEQGNGQQDASHRVAQEGAGEHAESQYPVAW